MAHMNISLPKALRDFVDHQVNANGYDSSGEYVRELIRRDRDVQRLRELILEGASSPRAIPADSEYFQQLRKRVIRES